LMFEPTETESKAELDRVADIMLEILKQAERDPEAMHHTPHNAVIGRPDEVKAARNPILRYQPSRE
ncbi:MAG: aminomethyl-transferring glycine dehydrogenase subunit GcvPB, partial [Clostridia bacterium]